MAELKGKYEIELNIVGDGRVFLNYWDWAHGNDVVAEIIDGKLMYDAGNMKDEPITFNDFINLVKETIKKR